jgi:hypothetical protein
VLCFEVVLGGAGEDRTRDLLTASQALSQLSYSPTLMIFKELRSVLPLLPI